MREWVRVLVRLWGTAVGGVAAVFTLVYLADWLIHWRAGTTFLDALAAAWRVTTIGVASSLIVATLAALILSVPLAVAGRSPTAFDVWDWTLLKAFGARGRSVVGFVGVLGVMAGVRTLAIEMGTYMPMFRGLIVQVLHGAATVAGLGVALAAYRIVTFFWPRWQTRHIALGFLVGATAHWVFVEYVVVASPHGVGLLAMLVGIAWIGFFAALIPRQGRERFQRVLAWSGAALVIVALVGTLTYDAADEGHTMAMFDAELAYPSLSTLQAMADLDGDGDSSLWDGTDCDDLDPEINVRQPEVVDNGVDDNCVQGDLESVEPRDEIVRPSFPPRRPLPNVIVITVDALRHDYLGMEVDGKPVTPNLDAFADEAVTFEEAYSSSTNTSEALPSAFSGDMPHKWHSQNIVFRLTDTVPAMLNRLGYQTVAFTTLPWLHQPFVEGFQTVDNTLGDAVRKGEQLITGDDLTRRIQSFLDGVDPQSPLFLWAHYYDPHGPKTGHPPLNDWLGADNYYLHEVHLTDVVIGRLFDTLREKGMYEDSIIVVFADHGEALGAHGLPTHLWGAWQEVVRVPFMLKFPGVQPRRIDVPVSTIDFAPTTLDWLGIPYRQRDGRSLAGVFQGEELDVIDIYVESNDENGPLLRGVITPERRKLIYDSRRNAYQLFRLDEDPGELNNLIGDEPETFDRLRDQLWTWWEVGFNTNQIIARHQLARRLEPLPPPEIIGDPVVGFVSE